MLRYDVHEREVGEMALEMGFEQVSLSSTIMPMVRVVPRGYTGKVNFKLLKLLINIIIKVKCIEFILILN